MATPVQEASIVLACGLAFPEGPAFASDGSLWCVELHGGALVRIAEGTVERHKVASAPNGLAIDRTGRLWFCDPAERAIRRFEPATGRVETLAAGGDRIPFHKPNDLAFAADGTLVFTCPDDSRTEPTGTVWSLADCEEPQRVAEGLYFPNGLAFVDRGRSLVVAETYRHRLWKGGWDAQERRWIDPKPFADVGGPVGPDGMALGANGMLYVAVFGQSCVKAVAPDGRVTAVHRTPGARPTNCAFDPSGALGLVVTEAQRGEVLSFPGLGPGAPLFQGAS